MGQDKDFEYLGKIQDYFSEHKTLPTFSHVAQLLGFKSKNAVSSFVARLKLQGFLDYAPDKRLKPGRRFFERILAESTVQAGFATPSYGDSLDTIGIDDYLIEKPSQTILITVRGDSMKDAGIFNGDVVIVEKRAFANVGDIVVAILNKEFTLKTLGKENGQFVLIPANKDFPVIRPEGDFEIFGVVVGQFRKYT